MSTFSFPYTRDVLPPVPFLSLTLLLLQKGNLQDKINANVVNATHFSEHEMLKLFRGTCLAVQAMHEHYEVPSSNTSNFRPSDQPSKSQRRQQKRDDDDDDERFPHPEGDSEGGYSYASPAHVPLVTRERAAEVVFDGEEEEERQGHTDGNAVNATKELVPYAHRDLKPGLGLPHLNASYVNANVPTGTSWLQTMDHLY